MPPKHEQILVDRGLVSQVQLDDALSESRRNGRSLQEILLRDVGVDEQALLEAFADQYGIRYLDLKSAGIDPRATQALSAKLVAHYLIAPISLSNGTLTIAVNDPLEFSSSEDIESNFGFRVERVLAKREDILEAIRRDYGVGAETVERILDQRPLEVEELSMAQSHDLETMAEDASVVRLVNQLLQQAIEERTTDIHVEAHADGIVARRRVDGVLYDTNLPRDIRLLYPAIVSRIKLMSGLNIVERRMPQDGRARVNIGKNQYDLRVSVVPAMHGEDIVIRILPSTMLFSLAKLGLGKAHLDQLHALIDEPHGILFVTGPTGSGKSTTLYACLSRLNTRERKIITIEDPIEYELAGITQTQINPQIGLTFAQMLRSMLRHDPDVMMVGEVRDRETAEIAIQTSMTGHLVLSTLHTNDSSSGAVRLMDMTIDPYLITSTVRAFVAQRLVRVICTRCKEPVERDGRTSYEGKGCRECHQTGFHGRVAICEILPLTDAIRDLVHKRSSSGEIMKVAVEEGMVTLNRDGWDKVERGVTTAEEVLRVTRL
ncbi:MAG: ATPase, T2SS/T4P/T4SS family [Verrucomicrobia bacterium]|nr:ATPase, T2SS/T4P/T4SS family [Verrucomicrobiota bacterium]MDA1087423.1 ATPase, T2SS/T4P/T4SS family [Verrucomicrobiota bacterium]